MLPAVLDALGLQGLLEPVRDLLGEVVGYIPNLGAAGLVLLVGWLGARIVQRVVGSLLEATGIDAFGKRMGLATGVGIGRISGLVGTMAYAVILLLAAVAALESLQIQAISAPASAMLTSIFAALPAIFTAAGIVLVGYLVARFAGKLTSELLTQAGFNGILQRLGISDESGDGDRPPAQVAGYLATVAIMLFAAIEASSRLGFGQLADLLVGLTELFGRAILGLAVFGFGLYLASLLGGIVSRRGGAHSGVLGLAVRASIIVLSLFMALREVGIAAEIINLAFGLILGAAALAAAIGIGLGSRDIAAQRLGQWLGAVEADTSSDQKKP